MTKTLADLVAFHDRCLAARYASGKIPIATLFEAYFDGKVDFRGDIYELLAARHELTSHTFTPEHVRYFVTKFVPQTISHTKGHDQKLVRGHYDRGNDFFAAFLGPSMVYTSAYFAEPGQSLEQGQEQKLDRVCSKLTLRPGERFLDVGCGWGTLVLHAAKHYGVDATGVTLSRNQADFGNARIAAAGLAHRARILCMDYRDLGKTKFDKIASLEMVEHVGVKHLSEYFRRIHDLLADDGRFVLQWTGLRRRSSQEDLVWGLFMSKYVFPGADASLPLGPMMSAGEKAGFEVQTVENVSPHYRHTILKWHKNWIDHRAAIVASYGERWYRIWNVFLAWSAVIAGQGTAACFQVLLHKNLNAFDREQWIGARAVGTRAELPAAAE